MRNRNQVGNIELKSESSCQQSETNGLNETDMSTLSTASNSSKKLPGFKIIMHSNVNIDKMKVMGLTRGRNINGHDLRKSESCE